LKILILHNQYQTIGGEGNAFAAEAALLKAHGHDVTCYTKHNETIEEMTKFSLARVSLWNHSVYKEIRSIIQRNSPEVLHFHNPFPLIFPAAYYASKKEGVPVVQTLHNYRLLCLNALLYRNGGICEECLNRLIPWPGVKHACYRNNHMMSSAVATMVVLNRALRTWKRTVDRYIALTDFSRRKLISGGLPPEKIVIKPNFLHPDPGYSTAKGGFGLFVGRLSTEKGIETLLKAWLSLPNVQMKIVGDGPLMANARKFIVDNGLDSVEILGQLGRDKTIELIKRADFLVVPSGCYEHFPLVFIEAFACGTPVIASRVGAGGEIVDHGRTGTHFEPGNTGELVEMVEQLHGSSELAETLSRQGRLEYERHYTGGKNYEILMGIYKGVIGDHRPRSG